MKKTYERPKLEEYGKIRDLTYGATGNSPDYNIVGGQLNVIGTCTTNVSGGGCVKFS